MNLTGFSAVRLMQAILTSMLLTVDTQPLSPSQGVREYRFGRKREKEE